MSKLIERVSPLTETGGAEPAWRALTLWHLAAELEHRTVTFDAYDAAFGGWSYRTAVGTWSQGHFLRALVRMAAVCRHDLVPDAATVREAGWYSLKRHTRLGTIGGVVKALSPRYNPRRVPLSDQIVAVAAQQGVSLG